MRLLFGIMLNTMHYNNDGWQSHRIEPFCPKINRNEQKKKDLSQPQIEYRTSQNWSSQKKFAIFLWLFSIFQSRPTCATRTKVTVLLLIVTILPHSNCFSVKKFEFDYGYELLRHSTFCEIPGFQMKENNETKTEITSKRYLKISGYKSPVHWSSVKEL